MGRFRRFFRHNDLFITYMLPFAVAFVVLFIYMLTHTNMRTRASIEEDVQNLMVTRVEDLRYRMDSAWENVRGSLTRIGSQNESLILMKYTTQDAVQQPEIYQNGLTSTAERLESEKSGSRVVENYGVYYSGLNKVVQPDGVFEADEYLRDRLGVDDDTLFERQLNDLKDLSFWVLRDQQNRVQYIMASEPYPQGRNVKLASGFALLSNSVLREMLRDQTNEYSNFLLLDQQGDVLLSAKDDGIPAEILRNMIQNGETTHTVKISGLLIYCIPSNQNSWYYASVVSVDDFRQRMRNDDYLIMGVALATFLAALAVSYLLSRRVNRQIDEISLLLSSQEDMKEDQTHLLFNSLYRRLTEFVHRRDELMETVNSNRDMLLEMFFRDIILQRSKTEDTTEQFARLGIEWPKGTVFMALIRARGDTSGDQMRYRDLCRQWMERLPMENNEEIVFFPLQDDYLCCVVTVLWADRAPLVIARLQYQLRSILHQNPHANYELAMSQAYPNLSYLPNAYRACVDEMAAQFYGVEQEGGYMESVDYPYEKERQLLNCLLSGDEQHMLERLDEFFRLNFFVRPLNLNAIDQFAHLLTGTMRRAITESELQEDSCSERIERMYQRVDETSKVDQFCELFRNEFLWLCRIIADSRNNRTDVMAQRIRDYIGAHYTEELSMTNLAQELNLSMSYMSVVFKRCMGRNFSDYLNRYRISAAKDLLIHTDKTVSQIAEETGFISANTFIRTFKKVEGITPGQFRGTGLSEIPEDRI